MKKYTIEIDEALWNFLKEKAEPFVDTPSTVLHRLLLGDQQEDKKKSPPKPETVELAQKPEDSGPPQENTAPEQAEKAPDQVMDVNSLLAEEEEEAPDMAEEVVETESVTFDTAEPQGKTSPEGVLLLKSKKPVSLHLKNGKIIEVDSYEISENILYGKVLGCTLDFEVSEIMEIVGDRK